MKKLLAFFIDTRGAIAIMGGLLLAPVITMMALQFSGMLSGAATCAWAGRQARAAIASARVVGRGRRARRVRLDMQTPGGWINDWSVLLW